MRLKNGAGRSAAILLGMMVLVLPLAATPAEPTVTMAEVTPIAANIASQRRQMWQIGLRFKSAFEFYQALEKQANGGQPITWRNVPDWTGLYDRSHGGYTNEFDPDGPPQGEPPSAKFTPEYQARMLKSVQDRKNGIEFDPLSQCFPPTYPRWFSMPFMREFIVTPKQTTMIAEAFNSIRRIYTDGRGHAPVEDQFPTETGDSIGFWAGDVLVLHTNQSIAHIYERAQGEYTDQVEGIEVWRKVNETTIVANVWIYDPPALAEPWYTRQGFTMISNADRSLRINNWYCKGNSNNEVYETKEGGSQHADFTFMKDNPKTGAAGAKQKKSDTGKAKTDTSKEVPK